MIRHWPRRRQGLRRPAWKRSGMKRTPLDALWSRYIRARDAFRCQWEGCQPSCEGEQRTTRCGRSYAKNSPGYHAAHVFSRGKGSTRHDPENGVGLCYPHHVHADHNKKRCFYPWMRQRLGEERFNALHVRARTPAKVDRGLIKLALERRVKELEDG